ncbi:MAG: HEPN domain-containing protein [Caldilineaceae bacterium]
MSEPKPQLSEHIRQRTQEWLRKAEHELAYLAVAPLSNDDPPTDTTCRIAHIAAEYALKAYLMINKHKILKSHDLVVILDECISIHNDAEFEPLRASCQTLTIYRTDLLYPGSFPTFVSVKEAKAAIELANEIYEFIVKKLKSLGYSSS